MDTQTKNKARIIDIALQAGVSTATVDRVLNSRPGVRQKTVDRVMDAVRLLEKALVRPAIIPSIAADLVIDVVIAGSAGFANEILAKDLRRIAKQKGVELRATYPQRMKPLAQVDALESCLEFGSSGVIVQPLEHPAVREAVARFTGQGVPVVNVLTDLPGADALGYAGLDNRAAGRTAGLLMGRLCRKAGKIAVFWGGQLYRCHEEREIGFRTILRDEYPDLSVLEVFLGQDDPEKNYRMAKRLLTTHRDLCGIYSIGSGNRGIEKAMLESGRKDEITFVAQNLTPLTKQCLLSGVMDAVVHQDMARVADIAISAIIDHSVGRPVSIERVPVEIIMRENVR
ncbi:LacI family DNA-binding transcriptional regulator [Pelagibius sp. Alg239-R121]|uniref:LacI family DNA-binding transcriptional regulator n=1 Tax=Pelagibius sp. Alg239-R121 TaxID=2993448 RepID=UPI0024A6C3F2|nr:LacI family DNA-binding transcriptional regulator [Pelagibius sp. Alg239-R121]